MPAVLHAPLISTPGFMLKERTAEPLAPAFTAVNGRTSPPSPRKLYGINGMTGDTIHVRPLARNSPDPPPQDPKGPPPPRDDWSAVRLAPENGHQNGQASPKTSDNGQSPTYPGKRKRSSSAEDSPSDHSPGGSVAAPPRLDSYAMAIGDRDDLLHPRARLNLKNLQARALPPMERPDSDRPWTQSHDVPHNTHRDHQHDDARRPDRPHNQVNAHPPAHPHLNGMEDPNDPEHSTTTEMTRAGVQVDPKKRKRQFANRTKTGCGTCRRRKKKCDEAKPECNNCQRGGFICEGYANKVPWPKNGVQKPHPPLQARDRYPLDPAQLYHSHGTSRESYPEQNGQTGTDGVRTRPIVVEEHDRPPPARSGWSGGWSEPPRASYPPEQHHAAEYSQPPQTPTHGRPRSSEQHVPPSSQPPSSRPHNPRIYHHTPQTMSQVVNNPPAVNGEAALHHQAPPPPMAHTTGPPAPPPPHYAPPPPPPQRSEKDKMLTGEPFQPFTPQLVEERERCKGAVYRFNNTTNAAVDISRDSRDRHFREILMARWTHHSRAQHERPICGHFGSGVYVDTPFMCDYGYNLSIADNVDIGTHCKLLDSGRITIGRNTSIGANVTIDTQRTPTDSKAIKGSRRTAVAAEVHIGENVHIGTNCTILAGVSIGNGAIIHPGSVVVRDIPAQTVARGNPADYV